MKNLIDIKSLKVTDIEELFSKADAIKTKSYQQNNKTLIGKTIANLFFENSTRTLISFELAAKRLGAEVINVNISKSSTQKGESLKDSLVTLQAMGVDAFVIRHPDDGICEKIINWLKPETLLINAGDGSNQHPSQALLDCYTILQHKPITPQLKVAIIGDIKHSRVANSLIGCLTILGNTNINIYAPKALLPQTPARVKIAKNLNHVLENADVIIMLRIQKERINSTTSLELKTYHNKYGLNSEKLKLAKPDCIIMHPGPINRGVEISNNVANGENSVILEQVKNGVLIRQALLLSIL